MSKFTFTTPTKYADGTALSAADISTLTYFILAGTTNPPVANPLQVPLADVAAGTANADGSKTVTVQFADIGFVAAPNVKYYFQIFDSLGLVNSADSPVVTYTNALAPAAPGNFSVA